MNITPNLNKLKRVSPTKVWKNSKDFLAWLNKDQNINLLKELTGKELKIEALEKNLGAFKVNLVCREVESKKLVLVEVQSSPTDHAHLGQLITLAASLGAKEIIWIAFEFSEEHKLAIQWLNRVSNPQINLIGAELSLYQIENSTLAVSLKAVCEANPWNKEDIFSPVENENKELEIQNYYWQKLNSYISQNSRTLSFLKQVTKQEQIIFETQNQFFRLFARADLLDNSANLISVGLEFRKNSKAKAFLNSFSPERREEIENVLGSQLTWSTEYELSDSEFTESFRRESSFENSSGSVTLSWQDVDPCNQAEWSIQHRWIAEELERMKKIFSQEISKASNISREDSLNLGQENSQQQILGELDLNQGSVDQDQIEQPLEDKIEEEIFSG